MIPLAVGHPLWPAPTPDFDAWPIVGAVTCLVIATKWLGLRFRPATIAGCLALGPLVAVTVDTLGVGPTAVILLAITLAARSGHAAHGGDPERPV
jgi:hypothetical protein